MFSFKTSVNVHAGPAYTCISRKGLRMLNSSETSTLSWDFTSSITTARFTRESFSVFFSMYSLKKISCVIVTAGGVQETGFSHVTSQVLINQFAMFCGIWSHVVQMEVFTRLERKIILFCIPAVFNVMLYCLILHKQHAVWIYMINISESTMLHYGHMMLSWCK